MGANAMENHEQAETEFEPTISKSKVVATAYKIQLLMLTQYLKEGKDTRFLFSDKFVDNLINESIQEMQAIGVRLVLD